MSHPQSLEDAQWEAEYGEERARLLAEELAAAKADGGERDHDACFPKTEIWTVWIHRLVKYDLLVRFMSKDDALEYGIRFIKEKSKEHYFSTFINTSELMRIGQSDELQVLMFPGINHPKIQNAHVVSAEAALDYGVSGSP